MKMKVKLRFLEKAVDVLNHKLKSFDHESELETAEVDPSAEESSPDPATRKEACSLS
jgi:hypothetical protein